jgi:hypothetical protein
MDDVSKYPNLVAELIDNGWSERDIVKVVHTNIMRVFSDVEEVLILEEIIYIYIYSLYIFKGFPFIFKNKNVFLCF